MKKILAAALICAVSTFARWDYFPVIDHSAGQGKIASDRSMQIRYGMAPNLELFIANGSMMESEVFGGRFQMGPLSVGADIALFNEAYNVGIMPNVSYSMNLSEALSFGVGADFAMMLSDKDKQCPWNTNGECETAMALDVGGELDFALNEIRTIWVGVNVEVPMSDDAKVGLGTEDPIIKPAIGVVFSKDNVALGANIGFGIGDEACGYIPKAPQQPKCDGRDILESLGVDVTVGF